MLQLNIFNRAHSSGASMKSILTGTKNYIEVRLSMSQLIYLWMISGAFSYQRVVVRARGLSLRQSESDARDYVESREESETGCRGRSLNNASHRRGLEQPTPRDFLNGIIRVESRLHIVSNLALLEEKVFSLQEDRAKGNLTKSRGAPRKKSPPLEEYFLRKSKSATIRELKQGARDLVESPI